MARECTFEVTADQCEFRTKTNGDRIKLSGMDIDAQNAADLAYLIQDAVVLEVQIKEKV